MEPEWTDMHFLQVHPPICHWAALLAGARLLTAYQLLCGRHRLLVDSGDCCSHQRRQRSNQDRHPPARPLHTPTHAHAPSPAGFPELPADPQRQRPRARALMSAPGRIRRVADGQQQQRRGRERAATGAAPAAAAAPLQLCLLPGLVVAARQAEWLSSLVREVGSEQCVPAPAPQAQVWTRWQFDNQPDANEQAQAGRSGAKLQPRKYGPPQRAPVIHWQVRGRAGGRAPVIAALAAVCCVHECMWHIGPPRPAFPNPYPWPARRAPAKRPAHNTWKNTSFSRACCRHLRSARGRSASSLAPSSAAAWRPRPYFTLHPSRIVPQSHA